MAEALTKTTASVESAMAFANDLSKKEAAAAGVAGADTKTLAQIDFGAEENFDGLW